MSVWNILNLITGKGKIQEVATTDDLPPCSQEGTVVLVGGTDVYRCNGDEWVLAGKASDVGSVPADGQGIIRDTAGARNTSTPNVGTGGGIAGGMIKNTNGTPDIQGTDAGSGTTTNGVRKTTNGTPDIQGTDVGEGPTLNGIRKTTGGTPDIQGQFTNWDGTNNTEL